MIIKPSRIQAGDHKQALEYILAVGNDAKHENEDVRLLEGHPEGLAFHCAISREDYPNKKYTLRHWKINPEQFTSDEDLQAVCHDLLNEFNAGDRPFVIALHTTTHKDGTTATHAHLMCAELDARGKVLSNRQNAAREHKIARKWEKNLGHNVLSSRYDATIAEQEPELRQDLQPDTVSYKYSQGQFQKCLKQGVDLNELNKDLTQLRSEPHSVVDIQNLLGQYEIELAAGKRDGVLVLEKAGEYLVPLNAAGGFHKDEMAAYRHEYELTHNYGELHEYEFGRHSTTTEGSDATLGTSASDGTIRTDRRSDGTDGANGGDGGNRGTDDLTPTAPTPSKLADNEHAALERDGELVDGYDQRSVGGVGEGGRGFGLGSDGSGGVDSRIHSADSASNRGDKHSRRASDKSVEPSRLDGTKVHRHGELARQDLLAADRRHARRNVIPELDYGDIYRRQAIDVHNLVGGIAGVILGLAVSIIDRKAGAKLIAASARYSVGILPPTDKQLEYNLHKMSDAAKLHPRMQKIRDRVQPTRRRNRLARVADSPAQTAYWRSRFRAVDRLALFDDDIKKGTKAAERLNDELAREKQHFYEFTRDTAKQVARGEITETQARELLTREIRNFNKTVDLPSDHFADEFKARLETLQNRIEQQQTWDAENAAKKARTERNVIAKVRAQHLGQGARDYLTATADKLNLPTTEGYYTRVMQAFDKLATKYHHLAADFEFAQSRSSETDIRKLSNNSLKLCNLVELLKRVDADEATEQDVLNLSLADDIAEIFAEHPELADELQGMSPLEILDVLVERGILTDEQAEELRQKAIERYQKQRRELLKKKYTFTKDVFPPKAALVSYADYRERLFKMNLKRSQEYNKQQGNTFKPERVRMRAEKWTAADMQKRIEKGFQFLPPDTRPKQKTDAFKRALDELIRDTDSIKSQSALDALKEQAKQIVDQQFAPKPIPKPFEPRFDKQSDDYRPPAPSPFS